MIATIDKFANVPWEGRAGAFFGHVERHDPTGFYGAAEPGGGSPLQRRTAPDRPHHPRRASSYFGAAGHHRRSLRDGLRPVGVAPDQRGTTRTEDRRVDRHGASSGDADPQPVRARAGRRYSRRPASTATNSFFAEVDRETPSRLYVGVASPGRGPKLVFLRALQTLLAGAAALSSGGKNDPADPYLTALCYFNALRELGGARRIVDDEVRVASDELREKPRAPRARGSALRQSNTA